MNGTVSIDELVALARILRQEQTALESKAQAIETTIEFLRERMELPEPAASALDLSNKSQAQSVFAIALENDGKIKVTEARRVMGASGKFKNLKNSSAAIYAVLRRYKDYWEWKDPGEYQLTSDGLRKARDVLAGTARTRQRSRTASSGMPI